MGRLRNHKANDNRRPFRILRKLRKMPSKTPRSKTTATEESNPQRSILNLPTEILTPILNHLPTHDLYKAMQACKHFFHLGKEQPRVDLIYPIPEWKATKTLWNFARSDDERQRQQNLEELRPNSEKFLRDPRTATRIRSLKIIPIDTMIGGTSSKEFQPDPEAWFQLQSNILKAKNLDSLEVLLPRSTIHHGLLKQLPYLKHLTIPFLYVKTLFPLRLENLTLIHRHVRSMAEHTTGTVKDFSKLKTLRLQFDGGAPHNDGAAYVDLDTLPLKELVILDGDENFRVQVSRDIRTLRLLDLDHTPDSLRWLTFTAKSLRHLVLSRMYDQSLPPTPIEFGQVEILELYCCEFSTFSTKMIFPHLRTFSQTHCVFENDAVDPLHIAVSFLDTLKFLGLNFYYYKGGDGRIHDISATYQTLKDIRRSSCLKRCLLQGPFTSPPDSTKKWILHKQMIKPGSDDLETRKALLMSFDPVSQLRESQELKRFQRVKL